MSFEKKSWVPACAGTTDRSFVFLHGKYFAPAYKGPLDADVLDAVLFAGQGILGEHDEIGGVTRRERPAAAFLPRQVVAGAGRDAQRFLAREAALAELRAAVVVPARKRLPHREQ